jgi:hypothetical protein
MDELDWLTSPDPEALLGFIRGRVSDRKLQLLACACCRRVWHLPDFPPPSHHAVEVAEQYADGLVGEADLGEAARRAWAAYYPDEADPREQMGFTATAAFAATTGRGFEHTTPSGEVVRGETWEAVQYSLRHVLWVAGREEEGGRFEPERYRQFRCETADLMRCIVGNPFRPVTLDHSWRPSHVLTLARAAYEERLMPAGILSPDRLAVLADALEEAGCADSEVLSHLRGPGPHQRGCWALDWIRGAK